MIRSFLKYFIVFALLVFSGWNLMNVSMQVQKMEGDVAVLDKKIAKEQEKIRVLNAEWAYLNNPERLEAAAALALGLKATKGEAVISKVDAIPEYVPDHEVGADGGATSSSIPISYGYRQMGARQ